MSFGVQGNEFTRAVGWSQIGYQSRKITVLDLIRRETETNPNRAVCALRSVSPQVSSFVRAVNDIYDKVDFEGIKLINFKVKSLTVRNLFHRRAVKGHTEGQSPAPYNYPLSSVFPLSSQNERMIKMFMECFQPCTIGMISGVGVYTHSV